MRCSGEWPSLVVFRISQTNYCWCYCRQISSIYGKREIDIKLFINCSNYSRVHCQQKDCSCRENKSHEIPWWLSKHASISKVKNIPHCLKEKHNVMRVEEENEISSAHSCMVKEKNRRTWVLCDYCFRVGMSTRWRAAGYRGIQKKWTKKIK